MIGCALGGPTGCTEPAALLVEGGTLAIPACRRHGETAGKTPGATTRGLPVARPPRPMRPGRRRCAVLAFPGVVPATR